MEFSYQDRPSRVAIGPLNLPHWFILINIDAANIKDSGCAEQFIRHGSAETDPQIKVIRIIFLYSCTDKIKVFLKSGNNKFLAPLWRISLGQILFKPGFSCSFRSVKDHVSHFTLTAVKGRFITHKIAK